MQHAATLSTVAGFHFKTYFPSNICSNAHSHRISLIIPLFGSRSAICTIRKPYSQEPYDSEFVSHNETASRDSGTPSEFSGTKVGSDATAVLDADLPHRQTQKGTNTTVNTKRPQEDITSTA